MKKYLTIDFDIIMHPCIELYNDYDETADEFLINYPFLNLLPADLELYEQLTNFLYSQKNKDFYFMEDHHEFVKLTQNDGPFELINIDHHHDLGYGDNYRWTIPVKQVNDGNWVHKLWNLNRITKYTWIKDDKSQDPPAQSKKYLTEKHFISNVNLEDYKDCQKIFISHSPIWIPSEYEPLYNIWVELFKNTVKNSTEDLSQQEQEASEQMSFDL